MKLNSSLILLCSLAIVITVPINVFSEQYSSNSKRAMKDFLGCKEKKSILIEEECNTIGDKSGKICNDYK